MAAAVRDVPEARPAGQRWEEKEEKMDVELSLGLDQTGCQSRPACPGPARHPHAVVAVARFCVRRLLLARACVARSEVPVYAGLHVLVSQSLLC